MNKYKILTLLFLLISGVKSNADRSELYASSSSEVLEQVETIMTIIKSNGIDLNTLADSVTTFQTEAMLMHLMEQVMEMAQKYEDNKTYERAKQIYVNQKFIELSKQEDATEASNIIMLQRLLNQGADVNAQGIKKRTALYYAEKLNHHKTKQFLLENGADVNLAKNGVDDNTKATIFGLPALWLYAHPNIAYHLVKFEADVNSSPSSLHSLTQEELNKNFIEAAKKNEDIKTLISFLVQGANINAQDEQGRTALHYVLKNGDHKKMLFLAHNGADPEIQDKQGLKASRWYPLINFNSDSYNYAFFLRSETPLDLTSYVPVATFLQKKGKKKIRKKQADVVEFLIRNGSNDFSNTVMQLLTDNGSDVTALTSPCRQTF